MTTTATTLDYLDDPAGRSGRRCEALDATLQAWIEPQLEAIRKRDPSRPVTVDHVDPFWPTCRPTTCSTSRVCTATRHERRPIRANLSLSQPSNGRIREAVVLSEFGYATDTRRPRTSQPARDRYLLGLLANTRRAARSGCSTTCPRLQPARAHAGRIPAGWSPKPVVAALAALRTYLTRRQSDQATSSSTTTRLVVFATCIGPSDALLLGGKKVDAWGQLESDWSGAAVCDVEWPGFAAHLGQRSMTRR